MSYFSSDSLKTKADGPGARRKALKYMRHGLLRACISRQTNLLTEQLDAETPTGMLPLRESMVVVLNTEGYGQSRV